ncbi:hypothetical protein SAMN05660443_0442 [Marinospirillum celere]|uniref:Uncharacterized protein n=1 Tax=Marinospirillum celere TaxID=1122252 RepID=A0A1I1E918_9GAMM|nr:hypothetical protein [Marinospirillum celere]SFB83584.1 hypothetical protein SAMN05660443_0442 [Marinospirillum celere]
MQVQKKNSNSPAITQWQLGEWIALANNPKDELLAIAAQLETGQLNAAESQVFQQADKATKIQMLVSALHNTLGRSALLLNKQEEAHSHFTQALEQGPYPGDPQLLAPLRMAHQASQLGIGLNNLTGLQLHLTQASQTSEQQTPLTKQLYGFLDQLLIKLAEEGKTLQLDGMPVFNGKDPFMAGKTVMALAYWVTEYTAGDPITGKRIHLARKIIKLLENQPATSWGAFFYLKGLKQLHKSGLLDACFSVNHLIQLKDQLHWNTFVDPKTYQLKSKPTNFYQVAYAIAQLRFQIGWEGAEPSYSLLEALQNHYEDVSGEFGFADETKGKGRYDRYSFLLVAEIAQRMREAGMPLPNTLKKNLRSSADYVLINLNEQGDGFQYGRSIGAYGDTAFLEILTAAAWYGLLSPEEMHAAHYFSCLCTQKFIDYWWDEQRGTVNLWEDGRVTDGYRGKHRILGENFSLIYQHLYTQNIWQELGYSEAKLSKKEYQSWLKQLPKATLTWFHKGKEGDSQQALFTYRDKDRIFNLPLVNGEEYVRHSTYLPIPYTREVIQGQPDTEVPLLLPVIQEPTGEGLWPVGRFTEISLQQEAEGYTLTWQQELSDNLLLLTRYQFSQGKIEREDTLKGEGSTLHAVCMQWPDTLKIDADEKLHKEMKLSFKGYQIAANGIEACYQTDKNTSLNELKLGWSLAY